MLAGQAAARLAGAVALALLAATLHGCGKSGGPGPTPDLETTTTTITTTQIGPLPAQPELPFKPLRGICYQAPPGRSLGPQLPGLDMMQAGYEAQWGPRGRDDLGMIRTLGANAVRLYHSAGSEADTDHQPFLDRAHELGLHVLLGFHTQNLCPNFNCFEHWHRAAARGFAAGLAKNGSWHPAIKAVVLMDEPDLLNLMDEDGTPVNCTGAQARCRTRAVLSSLDGFLSAEKEANLDGSNISLTVAWSFTPRDSIDGQFTSSYVYGFQDTVVGVKSPLRVARYLPQNRAAVRKAFKSRWVHSVNVPAQWSFAKEMIADQYAPFKSHPWFIAQFTPKTDNSQDLASDLRAIEAETKNSSSQLLGVALNTFQKDYQRDQPSEQGLFGLGEIELGNVTVCQEDVLTDVQTCSEFPVYCLNASAGDHAFDVATAWGGSAHAHGSCPTSDDFFDGEDISLVVV
mmetsp:Transcript_52023/g.131499  ORF Transcript_52023/g.131499 Transcript_52023/m.131499 type:complete len:458 (+) Transcript_52023:51-1424(+)